MASGMPSLVVAPRSQRQNRRRRPLVDGEDLTLGRDLRSLERHQRDHFSLIVH
jgi:hypothetical protein